METEKKVGLLSIVCFILAACYLVSATWLIFMKVTKQDYQAPTEKNAELNTKTFGSNESLKQRADSPEAH